MGNDYVSTDDVTIIVVIAVLMKRSVVKRNIVVDRVKALVLVPSNVV